ncbi:MAG: hypothetical protein PHH23_05070 [Paludibacteraceae bacterium]|nr:hypothetical protein [Paludibacteraceae bacterium]
MHNGLTRCNDNDKAIKFFSISANSQFDKLIKIQDAFQNTTTVVYEPYYSNKLKSCKYSMDGNNNALTAETSISDMGSWSVVKYYDKRSNNTLLERFSHSYGTALIHKQGKGFLGYSQTTVQTNMKPSKITTTYQLNMAHHVLYPSVNTVSINNVEFQKDSFAYSIISQGKRYILLPTYENKRNLLKGLVSEKNYLNYDSYGNPQTITTVTGGITQTQTLTYGMFGSWCPNKVVSQATSWTNGNESSPSRTDRFYYNVKGNLTKKVVDEGDVNQQTTEYKNFDTFGHPLLTEVTANGQTRSSHVTYTSSGRFLSSQTDVLGQTVSYVWDEIKGTLMSETAFIGTTNYFYDGWGNLKETHYPDGIRKASTLQWAGNNSFGAKYYHYEETSGTSPVWTWYDAAGREVCRQYYGRNENLTSVFTQYDTKGRKWKVSEPTFGTTAGTWAETYGYDNYQRVTSVVTPLGTTNYAYNGLTTTITSPEGTLTTVLDAAGRTLSNTKNGKSVTFSYYPNGQTKTATPQDGQALAMEYDLQGNRTKLTDPDAGTVRSCYNGFGELLWERQKVHVEGDSVNTVNNYEATTGRLMSIVRTGSKTETTAYTYNSTHKTLPATIQIAGQHKQTFTYDAYGRTTNVREEFDGRIFDQKTEYDRLGRIKKETFPSGYYVVNSYDRFGNLTQVVDKTYQNVWTAVAANAKGQLTQVRRGNTLTNFGFDSRGFNTSITAGTVINQTYVFENNGNLASRQDNLTHQKDIFYYDDLNRLEYWDTFRNETEILESGGQSYDSNGNISSKHNVDSNISYGANGKPHAVTGISPIPQDFPTVYQDYAYTDFKKVKRMNEDDNEKLYTLTYGVDDQRRKSVYTSSNGTYSVTRHYIGNYEEKRKNDGTIEKIHYLCGGAVYMEEYKPATGSWTNSLYYGYHDFQGSLLALANANGGVFERYAYDPWGKRRNPNNWGEADTRTEFRLNRGYTMHEHIDGFGVIDMNGRMFDPVLAQFFSPDPYVQSPADWLNYNRYAYCYGNPFKYTDPDGEFAIAAFFIGMAACMLIDYGMQVAMNYVQAQKDPTMTSKDIWLKNIDWFDVGISGIIGGLTGGFGAALSTGAMSGIKAGEILLTSAIDITGNGFQEVTFSQFGTRVLVAGATWGMTEAIKSIKWTSTFEYSSVGAKGTSFEGKLLKDSYIKQNGIDAHALKYEYLGNKANIDLFNLYKAPNGQIFIYRPGCEIIWTNEFIP